jgi:hypothetical protein
MALIAAAGFVASVVAAPAFAIFAMATDVPADRLIKNLEKRVKENPDDAAAWYNLARASNYVFSTGSKTVPVRGSEDSTTVDTLRSPEKVAGTLAEAEALGYLRKSIEAYNRAIKLDPMNAMYRYGLASVCEAGQGFAGKVGTFPMLDVRMVSKADAESSEAYLTELAEGRAKIEGLDEWLNKWMPGPNRELDHALEWTAVRRWRAGDEEKRNALRPAMDALWRFEVRELYFESFAMAIPAESRAREIPLMGLNTFMAYQALNDYQRLVPVEQQPIVRKQLVSAAIKGFESLPPCGAITPIVIPLGEQTSLGAMLAPEVRVSFDLDGTQRKQEWSWVSPKTGLLCWDPGAKGAITSGRQLFGSATWWMMFDNGYRAMDSLDDDRDGALSGVELAGLAVWTDANSNGVSERGEVKPIAELGIVSLSTVSTGIAEDGRSLVSASGVKYRDGRVTASYDWVTEPVHAGRPKTPTLSKNTATNELK